MCIIPIVPNKNLAGADWLLHYFLLISYMMICNYYWMNKYLNEYLLYHIILSNHNQRDTNIIKRYFIFYHTSYRLSLLRSEAPKVYSSIPWIGNFRNWGRRDIWCISWAFAIRMPVRQRISTSDNIISIVSNGMSRAFIRASFFDVVNTISREAIQRASTVVS